MHTYALWYVPSAKKNLANRRPSTVVLSMPVSPPDESITAFSSSLQQQHHDDGRGMEEGHEDAATARPGSAMSTAPLVATCGFKQRASPGTTCAGGLSVSRAIDQADLPGELDVEGEQDLALEGQGRQVGREMTHAHRLDEVARV